MCKTRSLVTQLTSHKASAILLCGGRSTRMGRDKGLLEWEGRPLIVHAAELLQSMFQEVLLVAGDKKRYAGLLNLPILGDRIAGLGPLGGIYTGLLASSNGWNFVLACDMPRVRPTLIALLLSEIEEAYKVVVPRVRGHFEPLLAFYHKDCLPQIECLIAAGTLKPIELYALVPTKVVPQGRLRRVDPDLESFSNLNAPEDLKLAP